MTLNKRQKLVQERYLDNEEAVIKELKKTYKEAQREIELKTKGLQARINELQLKIDATDDKDRKEVLKSMQQSKIYQKNYQDALKKQIDSILDNMHVQEFESVSEYLEKCYEEGFLGTLYDLHGQDIPLIFPIDQEAMVRAVQTESKISEGLYKRLGEDVKQLKKDIASEVSRGIATGSSFEQIAQQIGFKMMGTYNAPGGALAKAMTIARTEGHRILNQSSMDTCFKAKEKGADVVKQWDSTLDSNTRSSHQKVDGEVRELDEPFSNGLMYPGDPNGGAGEVVNCRCAVLQRARWAINDAEIQTQKIRAEYFGLDRSDTLDDFKKKYSEAAQAIKNRTTEAVSADGTAMLANAYEKHRIKNGLKSTPYSELGKGPFNNVKANYANLSAESAAAFNDTISELAKEYDTPLQSIRTMDKNEAMLSGSTFASVVHNYETDTAELRINPIKCKDIEKLKERIKECSKKGYSVKIADDVAEKYIATHEFAHTLINLEQPLDNKRNWVNADYGKIRKARKELKAVHDEYMREVQTFTAERDTYNKVLFDFNSTTEQMQEASVKWKEADEALKRVKLSNYSLTSADEFVAEAFANEKLGTTPNPYSKKVLEILDKYFKG